jgi:hypothetical protein
LTASVIPETKFVPVTVIVPAGEPTRTLEGARVETVGTGLLTWTLLPESAATTCVPSMTESLRIVPFCSWEAGIVARISVLLMYVVETATPESWITVAGVNPVPVTTIVTADEPTGTSLGVTDLMASGAAVPPTPEADPEVAGTPPQPERRVRRRQKEKTRRKKLKGPAEHKFIESADYRNTSWRARKKVSAIDESKTSEVAILVCNWFAILRKKQKKPA